MLITLILLASLNTAPEVEQDSQPLECDQKTQQIIEV